MKYLRAATLSFLYVLCALVILPTALFAYESPGRATGFVNDFASVLSADSRASLETKLLDFEKQTGNEIVVATIRSLGDETIETYATRLFEEWGIGKEKKDTGALLLVALDDREVRIEVGYGLEPYLTDAATSRIIRETIVPAFQAGDYSGGIVAGADRMIGALNGMEDLSDERLPQNVGSLVSSIFNSSFLPVLIIFLLQLIPVIIYSKSWWLGGVLGFGLGFLIFSSLAAAGILAVLGLIADFVLSKIFAGKGRGPGGPGGMNGVWFGGFGGGGGFGKGGGFGGFGGGMSGGGGSSGRW